MRIEITNEDTARKAVRAAVMYLNPHQMLDLVIDNCDPCLDADDPDYNAYEGLFGELCIIRDELERIAAAREERPGDKAG